MTNVGVSDLRPRLARVAGRTAHLCSLPGQPLSASRTRMRKEDGPVHCFFLISAAVGGRTSPSSLTLVVERRLYRFSIVGCVEQAIREGRGERKKGTVRCPERCRARACRPACFFQGNPLLPLHALRQDKADAGQSIMWLGESGNGRMRRRLDRRISSQIDQRGGRLEEDGRGRGSCA